MNRNKILTSNHQDHPHHVPLNRLNGAETVLWFRCWVHIRGPKLDQQLCSSPYSR